MLKRILAIVLVGMSLSLPITSLAAGNDEVELYSMQGYTAEGVQYEVSGTEIIGRSSSYVIVERCVTYQGDVWPDEKIYWQEYFDGDLYEGVLYLDRFQVSNNVTTAYYTGNLYKY